MSAEGEQRVALFAEVLEGLTGARGHHAIRDLLDSGSAARDHTATLL